MTLYEFAKSELDRIPKDDDGMQKMMNNDILEIVKTFADQEHSRFTAGYALARIERLMRYKPISALTGEDSEWVDVSDPEQEGERSVFQNRRCPSVFKKADGTCYDNDAFVVSDDGGITWFRGSEFKKEITFPYLPPIHAEEVYIEYTEEVPPGYSSDEYEIITDKPDRIKALYEQKRKEFDEGQEGESHVARGGDPAPAQEGAEHEIR